MYNSVYHPENPDLRFYGPPLEWILFSGRELILAFLNLNFIIITLRKINVLLINISVDLMKIFIISVRFLFLNITASCA
jgi:hypothetical protein